MDPSLPPDARIDLLRQAAAAGYADLWACIIAEWKSPGPEDRAWLVYAANYLFRTGGVRWAVDPIGLNTRVRAAPRMDYACDLNGLSFVLLTHRHEDHLDLELISALRHLPIRWVVPEAVLQQVTEQAQLDAGKIIVAAPGEQLELDGLRIVPFEGLHYETTPASALKGVPAMGYWVESGGRRWLFPGDTRTYNARQLPVFGPVDVLFAHLWLGRSAALLDRPPLLEAFCQFCLDLQTRRVVVTHLQELGRPATEFWDLRHYELTRERFNRLAPEIPISYALMGDCVSL